MYAAEGVTLSLLRDRISLVYRSSCDQPRTLIRRGAEKASDRSARIETQISVDGGRAGIGHRRGTQDREVLRRTQV